MQMTTTLDRSFMPDMHFSFNTYTLDMHAEASQLHPVSINAKSPLPSGLLPEGKDLVLPAAMMFFT